MFKDLERILSKYNTLIYFKDLEIKEYKINLNNGFFTNRRKVNIKFLIPYEVEDTLYNYIVEDFDNIKNSNYGIKVRITIDKQRFFGDRIITILFDFDTKIDFDIVSLTNTYSERFIEDLKSLFKLKDFNKVEATKYIKIKY